VSPDSLDRRSAGPNDASAKETLPTQSAAERIWEQVSTFVIAVAIALGIRAFVIEPFRIPSGSMLPTLLIGDHLFVNKFVYGIKIPFTDIRLPGWREPERGDVVVFLVARDGDQILPVDEYPDLRTEDFVKRIVGLPGDRVELRGGRVYVNDERMRAEPTGAIFVDGSGFRLKVKREELEACEHAVLENVGRGGLRDMPPIRVPAGRYFMMGDNRDHSRDSRSWGTVRFEEMKGPAFILYWSWDVKGNFLQFLNPVNWWKADKRWDRLFQSVECGFPPELEGTETASDGASFRPAPG
jgi:signal peptidase I